MMYAAVFLTVFAVASGSTHFNWGPCNGWPFLAEFYEPLEILNPMPTRGSPRPFLHGKISPLVVKKNKHRWSSQSKNITCESTNGFTVPQDWMHVSSDNQMDYFLARFLADPTVPYKGKLWILNGGPGGSGQELWGIVPMFWNTLGGAYDLYIPDHRGTGNSSEITCPGNLNETACAQYVANTYAGVIQTYSVYQAASDVVLAATLVNNFDTRTAPTFIYGLSYGTYWLNRILQIAPDLFTASIMDGICPSALCRYAIYDLNADTVGAVFMRECLKDKFCSSQFGNTSPLDAITKLANDIDSGNNKCAAKLNLTREVFSQQNFGDLASFAMRVLIPPLVKRMIRCNAKDMAALKNFYPFLGRSQAPPSSSGIPILSNNILLSEMFSGVDAEKTPPSVASLTNISNQAEFATYAPEQVRLQWELWPKYVPQKRYYDKYAFTDHPLLLLNGDLDPQTPHYWAASAYASYKESGNARVNFVTVPRSVHCTVFGAPVNENMNMTCGLIILKGYLDSEGSVIDRSCTSKVLPIDWAGNTTLGKMAAKIGFNTTNLWGN